MICIHCGRESDPLFKFCLHCGKELAARKKEGDAGAKPAAPAKPAASGRPAVSARPAGESRPTPAPTPAEPAVAAPEPAASKPEPAASKPEETPAPAQPDAVAAEPPAPPAAPAASTPPSAPSPAADAPAEAQPAVFQPVAPKLQVIPGAKETTPDTGVIVRCARCRARIPVDAKQCPMCGHIVKPAAERKGDARAARETTQISAKRKVAGYLISVSAVDGRETVKVPIFEGKNTLGRERSDLQFPEDDLLSPQHLVVEVTEGAPLLKCLGSRNGTFVRLLDQVLLEHGDTFRVGQQLLRYEDLDILDPVVAPAEEGTEVMGSPAGPRVWGRLTQVVTETLAGASFLLANENVFLGRERGNITFPGDRYISGTHAVLIHKPDGTYLRDVGSSNGTYVRVKGELPLQSGQYFLAGRQLFKLQIGQ